MAIDKAKGIVSKPMPREWYDWHRAFEIEDEEQRKFHLSILADKKPYFMLYIYPDLMREYKKYVKTVDKKALRSFRKSVEELLSQDPETLTDEEREFVYYYNLHMPVSDGECVTNRVCKRFENAFDGYIGKHVADDGFDYRIMKSDAQYTRGQYKAVSSLFDEYGQHVKRLTIRSTQERVSEEDFKAHLSRVKSMLRTLCDVACPNAKTLCNIVLDICYEKKRTIGFAWNMCGDEIIDNLLARNEGKVFLPVEDNAGDIQYGGKTFSFEKKQIGDSYEPYFE